MAVAGRGVHAHGCTKCKGRYEDTCEQPNDNATCKACNGFKPWTLLVLGRLPRDCCRTFSRLASKDERKLYRLSEACTWFRCTTCSRTFPFTDPSKESKS